MTDNAKKGDDKTKTPPAPPAPAVPDNTQPQSDPLSPEKIKELITEALNVKLKNTSHIIEI